MHALGKDILEKVEPDVLFKVTDGHEVRYVELHRIVVGTMCEKFEDWFGQTYRYAFVWDVPEGCVDAASRLLLFQYVRNKDILADLSLTKKVCIANDMSGLYSYLRTL